MRKLIGMVDFVLQFGKESNRCNYEQAYDKISNYANFLKQPLELWMFVPCDEDGNVLVNDNITEYDREMYFEEEQIYQQEKERCLFEGCVYDKEMDAVRKDIGLMIYSVKYESNDTIEDLVKYDITLTKTAIKQLGL